jgi:cardiolipin synthase A/B
MNFTCDNTVKLLRCGAEYFPALEQAIEQAKVDIYIQTYIYQDDETGIRIGNALKAAAARGVAVNLLLDGFGSKELPNDFVHDLRQSGVHVMFYRPKISPWTLQKRRLIRMHRKVSVIDSAIGFVGGINILNDSENVDETPPRIDYAVQLQGSILIDMIDSVQTLWRHMSWMARLEKISSNVTKRVLRKSSETTFNPPKLTANGNTKAAFIIRNNILHRHDIEIAYLQAINNAKSEIIIANAYFLPSKRFRKAMLAATARGVRIKLLLQGRKEYLLMFATHALYDQLLHAGIEIFEYKKSFLHSKVAVVDSNWATVGSSNIDPLSLMLANEANVVIQEAQFANELKADIEHTIYSSDSITLETWGKSSLLKRFFSWTIYGFVKFFLGFLVNSNEKN